MFNEHTDEDGATVFRHIAALSLSVPSAIAKRPMRVMIAAVVLAFGMLVGAGIAAWLMPPA